MKSVSLALAGLVLLVAQTVHADAGAQGFVEKEQERLSSLLRQPASAGREAQIKSELDTMVDYDVLARRSFGDPCPPGTGECTNHWESLSPAQRTEVTGLLKQLVQKNYRKNLTKSLDYDITTKSTAEQGDTTRVRTQAKSRASSREAPLIVDYMVKGQGSNYRVVDMVTEGSSLTKNYYTQFHKMLGNPDQGYPHIVKKLTEKLAK